MPFNFAHPKLERVVYRALYTDQASQLEATANTGATWWSKPWHGVELAPEHDPDLVAWVFTTLTTEFGLHLMRRLQAEHGEFEAAELRERYTSQSLPLCRDLIAILENGLGRK